MDTVVIPTEGRIQRYVRKKGVWAIVLAVVALSADITGLAPWVPRLGRIGLPIFTSSVPLWVLLAAAVVAFLVGRRLASLTGVTKTSTAGFAQVSETEGSFISQLQTQLATARESVYVCFLPKTWVFALAYTTAVCRSRGVSVTVVVNEQRLRQRFGLLTAMGCAVVKVAVDGDYDFRGVVADPSDAHHGRALAMSIKTTQGIYGCQYFAPDDYHVIRAAEQRVLSIMESGTMIAPHLDFRPSIIRVASRELLDQFANVKAYAEATLELEEVEIGSTVPRAPVVMEAKLRQAHQLVDRFQKERWRLFEPAGITLANGKTSLLVPPVLEWTGQYYEVAEGHSRLYALKQRRVDSVYAIVVRNLKIPAPTTAGKWRNVKVSPDRREHKVRSEFARHIETGTHTNIWPSDEFQRASLL